MSNSKMSDVFIRLFSIGNLAVRHFYSPFNTPEKYCMCYVNGGWGVANLISYNAQPNYSLFHLLLDGFLLQEVFVIS